MSVLTLDLLRSAVDKQGAAFRARVKLDPAGGPGDKVFPPTYSTGEREPTKYALEERQVGDERVLAVLLDSVASQANRMEEALLAAWRGGEIDIPVVVVDFTRVADLGDIGEITSLEAPHRLADAILRDSVLDGKPYRHHELGRAFTEATPRNATAVYQQAPHALVFGMWDSTGPKGGMGSKFQRALVSEIVGLGVARDATNDRVSSGTKVGSRIDPLAIPSAIPIYASRSDPRDWTADRAEAAEDKQDKPVEFQRKGADKKGKPSTINHGNVAPTLDRKAGGVTFREAVQTTVLSLPALRRLQFPTNATGTRYPAEERGPAELAARTALAALGLTAIALGRERGYDLRSRALLVPRGPLALELVGVDGDVTPFALPVETATSLLRAAAAEAARHGLAWVREPARLTPAPKLGALVREARRLAEQGAADDGEE
ncbi:MAG: type I-U CRISPR-associated RAMP protein Csb1/Cas7u [Myxococcota bacterium]